MAEQVKPFRVLCLDGGGMRGLYSAVYLKTLTEGYAKKKGMPSVDFGKSFSLIAGTSTGGILACALAKGVALAEVISLYRKHGPKIFPQKVPGGLTWDLFKQVFLRGKIVQQGDAALREALVATFGDKTIGQLYQERGIALCIPAVDMNTHRSWLFKTPHLKHLPNHIQRDDNTTLADVCLATSAAPIFRALAEIPNNHSSTTKHIFSDGGLWANNPVLVALTEALDLTHKGDTIEIFCMSTSPRPAGEHAAGKTLFRGFVEWKFGAKVAELSIAAQEYAYDHMALKLARHLDRKVNIFRFPRGQVPEEQLRFLDLDETSDEGLNVLTQLASRDVDEAVSVMGQDGESGELLRGLIRDMLPANEESMNAVAPESLKTQEK